LIDGELPFFIRNGKVWGRHHMKPGLHEIVAVTVNPEKEFKMPLLLKPQRFVLFTCVAVMLTWTRLWQ
jgi:hypothetical protein